VTRAITNYAPIGEYRLRFSLRKISAVYAVIILSNLDVIFFISVEGIMSIGIQGEIK